MTCCDPGLGGGGGGLGSGSGERATVSWNHRAGLGRGRTTGGLLWLQRRAPRVSTQAEESPVPQAAEVAAGNNPAPGGGRGWPRTPDCSECGLPGRGKAGLRGEACQSREGAAAY